MNKSKTKYRSVGKLLVNNVLYNFVNKELLKKTKIRSKHFWSGLDKSLHHLREKNEKLLQIRKDLQNPFIKIKGDKIYFPQESSETRKSYT